MLTEEVFRTIGQYHMIEKGDVVILGLSGGGDSVCLFHILCALRKRLGYSLRAVHVHHGIRGEEADEDAAFVKILCKQHDVLLNSYYADVPKLARESGMTLEEAGRWYRYYALYKEAATAAGQEFSYEWKQTEYLEQQYPGVRIAVAHHANDQAETLLFHMARGTGIRGMGGMRPISGMLIRPFLFVEKLAILQELRNHQYEYREDVTNECTDYTRNLIRQNLLPELRQINRQAVRHISSLAAHMAACSEYIDRVVAEYLEDGNRCQRTERNIGLRIETLEEQPLFLQQEVMKRVLVLVAQSAKDISGVHVSQCQELMKKATGSRLDLPYHMEALRSYDWLIVRKRERQEQSPDPREKRILLSKEGTYELPDGDVIRVRSYPWDSDKNFSRGLYTKMLDCDKIKGMLSIRHPQKGDIMTINEKGEHKNLNRILMDAKVPREQRGKTWVVADEEEVLWLVGGRMSYRCQLDEGSKQVMELSYHSGYEEEKQWIKSEL
ncbi:MAG: tRNA lysidine(34) synthetase TilS [Lachnospiraceae bacterium]